jgi:hypothetical protein
MPTRPVTWELDVPPDTLLEPAKKTPPASSAEIPSIDALRSSLTGTRFELLKVSTFAAFLLAFVGVAVHGSQIANPDNQFVANTGAALKGLISAVSNATVATAASLRAKSENLALAARSAIQPLSESSKDATPAAPVTVTDARTQVAQLHHKPHVKPAAPIAVASIQPYHVHRAHHRKEPTVLAAATQVPIVAPDPQWSGNLLDLPDFVSAESSRAGQRILSAVHGGASLSGLPHLRNAGERAISSFGAHFDAANPASATLRDPSSILSIVLSPDTAVAAGAALVLYMIFVVLLIQIKGGLRSYGGSHAV